MERNTLHCLDIFQRHNCKATFFILTTVAEMFPELIREIERRGHEIGIHAHRHRLVYNLTPGEFEDDLTHSFDILRGIGVKNIFGHRAPYWSVTRKSLWALEILQRHGLKYDASVFPIRRRLYGIPDARAGMKSAPDFGNIRQPPPDFAASICPCRRRLSSDAALLED